MSIWTLRHGVLTIVPGPEIAKNDLPKPRPGAFGRTLALAEKRVAMGKKLDTTALCMQVEIGLLALEVGFVRQGLRTWPHEEIDMRLAKIERQILALQGSR